MDDQRWETQALRESQARRSAPPVVSQDKRPVSIEPALWVTIREASDATGIPTGTLGSWARRGTVDSYLEGNGGRKLRIVDLNDVRGRARELGRPIAPVPVRAVAVEEEPPSPPMAGLPPKEGETVGENVMIVPLDAWNKMLNQLGNLHEAGQQLADARERAAKAETEATFLRERLAELREQQPPSRPYGSASPHRAEEQAGETDTEPWMPHETEPIEPAEEPAADPEPANAPVRLWRYLYGGWKSRGR